MRYTYIFIGLTPSERALLESLMALDSGGGDGLVPVAKPEEANLIVANGDDASVVECLRAGNPQALIVLVGQPPRSLPFDLPVLRRPLEMQAVAEVLAQLDWPEDRDTAAPASLNPVSTLRAGAPTIQPPVSAHPPESQSPESQQAESQPPMPQSSAFAPTTASMPITAPHVSTLAGPAVSARATWAVSERAPLIAPAPRMVRRAHAATPFVDDADADLMTVVGALGRRSHTLPRGIRRLGFRVRLIEGADAALAAFAQRPVDFVFLDQASLGDDLLPLARALTAQRPMPGHPPHVVVVARRGTAFDRLRARLIGCVWMVVPVDRERLLGFLARRGLHPTARPRH